MTENANQEVSGAAVAQAGSTTTLTFTRPLAPTDSSKTTLSSEEGERSNFLWAYGADNSFAYHGTFRGSVSLSDLFCTTELSAEAEGDADCTSSDPDYEFEVAPSGDADELALFWTVSGSSVAVKVILRTIIGCGCTPYVCINAMYLVRGFGRVSCLLSERVRE